MSFRLADLKKSVRKTKDGHVITPTRLEGRSAAFRIEFLLQQFEEHRGRPRRMLDPQVLLEFIGDPRLGRGLLAALSQWYRTRPLTFAEVLDRGGSGGDWRARFDALGIHSPVELRAWLYAAANAEGSGYLDPGEEGPFWSLRARALGVRRDDLARLILLDRADEAVLVRTGPRPAAEDAAAVYNARAHTTLLRAASEVTLRCGAPASLLERAAAAWAGALAVEWRVDGPSLRLSGQADALGCWTRHGRRVERAALELLACPDLAVREVEGRVYAGDRQPRFRWDAETLSLIGAGSGPPFNPGLPEQVEALAQLLRRERDRSGADWAVRRPGQMVAVEGAAALPHLELRRGDTSVWLRLGAAGEAAISPRFEGKLLLAGVGWAGHEELPASLHLPGGERRECPPKQLLGALAGWLEEGAGQRGARRAA